jgi:hypothetical protein
VKQSNGNQNEQLVQKGAEGQQEFYFLVPEGETSLHLHRHRLFPLKEQ